MSVDEFSQSPLEGDSQLALSFVSDSRVFEVLDSQDVEFLEVPRLSSHLVETLVADKARRKHAG